MTPLTYLNHTILALAINFILVTLSNMAEVQLQFLAWVWQQHSELKALMASHWRWQSMFKFSLIWRWDNFDNQGGEKEQLLIKTLGTLGRRASLSQYKACYNCSYFLLNL